MIYHHKYRLINPTGILLCGLLHLFKYLVYVIFSLKPRLYKAAVIDTLQRAVSSCLLPCLVTTNLP